jgi:hypothetical protein
VLEDEYEHEHEHEYEYEQGVCPSPGRVLEDALLPRSRAPRFAGLPRREVKAVAQRATTLDHLGASRARARTRLGAPALFLTTLLACSHRDAPPAPAPPPPTSPAFLDASRQLLTAIPADWDATTAELRRWRRDAGGAWQPDGAPWPVVLGRRGTAWGRGLHGDGAPDGQGGPLKVEGDGKSPAGVFALRPGYYGYAAAPLGGVRLTYTAVDASWQCVDDAASSRYDTIVDRRTVAIDWASAEQLRRDDALYTWIVDVDHNPRHTPGAGSCIFLHVWSGPGSVTAGCTAMDQGALEALLRALDPAAAPAYVLLPRAEYDALAGRWHLPPRT